MFPVVPGALGDTCTASDRFEQWTDTYHGISERTIADPYFGRGIGRKSSGQSREIRTSFPVITDRTLQFMRTYNFGTKITGVQGARVQIPPSRLLTWWQ